MKRKFTRRDVLGAGVTTTAGAVATGLAGCGNGSAGGGSNGGRTTLTWWDYWDSGANDQAMQAQLERYQEANSDIVIERRKLPFDQLKQQLLRGASAGQLPDIVVIDNPDHQSFAELGILEDLTERVESWGEFDAFFDGPRSSTMWEGKIYGIPDNSNCLTLWYNEEMLAEAGVEPPTNWAELEAAARALTEGNRYGLAVSAIQSEEGTFQWLPFLWQAGEDIPTIDSAGGQAALQLWVDLVQNSWMSQGILDWDQEAVKDQFVNQQAAMMINGPWQIPIVEEEAPDLAWNVVPLPEGQQSASILGGENRAIISGGENVEAAWDLIEWSQQPEELKQYLVQAGKLPSREDLADDPNWSDDPVVETFTEQLRVAKARAYGPSYPEISSAIQDAIQGAISGQSEVSEALADAQPKITPLLPQNQ